LTRLARTEGIALRTAQRWVQRYRAQGLAGLARRPRADRGTRTFPPDLIRLIEGLALRTPRPTVAAVHRQVATVAVDQGWPVPSYDTVHDVVRRLDPAFVVLAREGARAYSERFDLIYRREAAGPNAIWQADHTQLDVWIRDDRDRAAKPWLTVILADYSRAVAGFRLSCSTPSALQTALALRDAIGRKPDPHWHVCGIPAVFYTDHGSDFTSQHLEQVAADLKMVLVFSLVGQPRGRGRIERFFATVNQLFLCTLPGYAPPGTPPVVPVLTLAELDSRLYRFVVEEYHQRVHSETGLAPQARWEAGGFLPRLPASAAQLDLLLLTVAKARRVHQDGIHFQGLRYLDLTLAAYVGETVTIRYDPRDLAEIRVFHRDRFLCRAVCPELAATTIGLKDLVRARNARRRELRAGI
ncbi:MAG: Mu transposase C-terminal domain-containing protein, partial [Trueperaceae bacterium]